MRALVLVCALTAWIGTSALAADNVIKQHNTDLEPGTHYTINQGQKRVTILLGVQYEIFEFEAGLYDDPNDPNSYAGPGIINGIEVDPNAGEVAITVVGHDGHTYGAQDVGKILLDVTGVVGTVVDVDLSRST